MTDNPFFSIIIPTLDEEETLPNLLADIDLQDFKSYELLIVDGNSKDNTQQIVTSHPKAKLIISPKSHVAVQRNLGATTAKGEYLLFFDADSRIPPYFLTGIKYRLSIHSPDIFTTWTDQDGNISSDKAIVTAINVMLESNRFLEKPILALGAFIGCKKSVFTVLKGFNEQISYAEDRDFVDRSIDKGYSYKVFRDPKFTYSLRRFRKEGNLPMLRKNATIYSAYVLNGSRWPTSFQKNYPMLGGSYYKKNIQQSSLFENLHQSLLAIKKLRQKRALSKLFERFFRGEN